MLVESSYLASPHLIFIILNLGIQKTAQAFWSLSKCETFAVKAYRILRVAYEKIICFYTNGSRWQYFILLER